MPYVKLWIPGDPVAKPRMTRRDQWAQRPCVVKYRAWADHFRECAGDKIKSLRVVEVTCLSWTAYYQIPKSYTKKEERECRGQLKRTPPDRDNIDKAVLDILFPDGDAHIAKGTIAKYWCDEGQDPGLTVTIEWTAP